MSSYSKAVDTLAKGITAKTSSLNKEERTELARELLHAENPQNNSEWKNIEIALDPQKTRLMAQYSRKLRESYSQEIGKNIQDTLQKVDETTNLRETLQQEIRQALNETKELEKIAKRLQDKGIGKIAGKEEKQVNKLGEDLERINREGKELEKDKQKITQILEKHNLDQSDLHDELGRRASSIETILQVGGSGNSGSANNLDQIAQRIIQRESELKDAETKKLHKIEDNIRTLSRIVDIEKQEMEALDYVESKMKQGDFGEAVKLLDNLIGKRQDFGNKKDYSQVRKDLEDEQKIIQAVGELFESIEMLETEGIQRNRLYDELASQGPFSSPQEAENMLEKIENEFEEMEDDIKKITALKQQERKLENLEHEKLKRIDDEDAQFRKQASPQDKKDLKSIHEKLQKLGFSLENKIDDSKNSSSTNNGSSSKNPGTANRKGPYGGKYGRPTDSEPWIISISDVESNYPFMKKSLSLLEKHGWDSVVEEGSDGLKWDGGNKYRFILNGDLLDRGDNPEEVWNSLFNMINTSNFQNQVEMTIGNHDLPLMVPGSSVAISDRTHSTCVGQGLEKFYNNTALWFLMPGKPHEKDLSNLSKDEITSLRAEHIQQYRDLNYAQKYGVHKNYKPVRKEEFAKLIEKGNVKMIAKGYNYYYVHGGSKNNPGSSRSGETYQEYYNRMLLEKVAEPILEDIKNGKRDNEMNIRSAIHNGDNPFDDMFSPGRSDGGLIWLNWDNVPENAGNQITGHTGGNTPREINDGQLINENTHSSGGNNNPSIVIETPEGVFALSDQKDEPIDLVGY